MKITHKASSITDYQKRINNVMIHIDNHLEDSLSLDELANIACFSRYHFHRIFTAFVGEPVSEYIRRIRLESAANKLINARASITEIAFDSQYETPAAFTKAFKKYFGINPSDFRHLKNIEIGTNSPAILNRKTEKNIQPVVKKLSDQKILFVRKTGRYDVAAKDAWSALTRFASPDNLMGKDTKMIGISHDNPNITHQNKLRYDACITIDNDVITTGEVGIKTIRGGFYAIFTHKGPYENFSETYNAIFFQWLPESGYKLRDVPAFDVYLNSDANTKPKNLRTEIYLPIEKQ